MTWEVHKIELLSIPEVMAMALPGLKVDLSTVPLRPHRGNYGPGLSPQDFLTPPVLELLNMITAVEQTFFGYQPHQVA